MNTQDAIPLSKLIAYLREELQEALLKGKGKETRFEILETELELSVALTKKVDGKVGVNFWVYTAEASGGIDQLKTQKIRLKLKPVGAIGENLLIKDEDVTPPRP